MSNTPRTRETAQVAAAAQEVTPHNSDDREYILAHPRDFPAAVVRQAKELDEEG